jgi:Ca2+-transporting ATPase
MEAIPWHTLNHDALLKELHSDAEAGLTERESRRRLAELGANALPQPSPTSPLKLFLQQFSSLIVWVLIGAALISGLLQEWVDAAAIIAIVILNAILGFVQEFRAERSLDALKQMVVVTARVIRDSALVSLPARELVPGDLIQIEAGDRIPADARIVYATGLQTQEAALTGESTPVTKSIEPMAEVEVPLGDRRNMVYTGTVAVSGKARAIVVATGIQTELGKIAALIHKSSEAEQEDTPLQRRLQQLGHTLVWLSLGIVLVVFVLGVARGVPLFTMFLTSVSLAVAAIPEGLPAVVTITLALGVTRMAKRHALIRRLSAVETLGSTSVICSDKTGTLTKNEMTVTAIYQAGEIFTVSGEGYTPQGKILASNEPVTLETRPGLDALLRASVLCNGAELRQEGGAWKILGDPTEGALLVAAAKAGLRKELLERNAPFLGEVPFDSERKKMTIVRRTESGPVAFVKGAPDVLLRDCHAWIDKDGHTNVLSDEIRSEIVAANQRLASQGLRVLGMATRRLDRKADIYAASELERELIFLGLIAMKDPVRPEAKLAVEQCRGAGIRTVMITGDHKETAVAIAGELGIMEPDMHAVSGIELDLVTDGNLLAQRVERIAVYARVSSEHKLRVVRAWKSRGVIVAMTGDGVNDAPAVKEADIGIAMGLSGTDVTKEASDMVVTDDNFASIAAAVEEGRAIYDNIRKSIHYLLSCNASEVLVVLVTTLLALPLPLLPVQILWINLVTDGLPALALAVDPKDPNLMRRPPRRPQERVLERDGMFRIFGQGLLMTLITTLVFVYSLYSMDQDLEQARTLTFMVLVGVQLAHALNCRSDRESLFTLGFWTNKPLVWAVAGVTALQVAIILHPWTRDIFKVTPLNPEDWILAFAAGGLMIVAVETWKAISRHRQGLRYVEA